jgi:hypothetical protein
MAPYVGHLGHKMPKFENTDETSIPIFYNRNVKEEFSLFHIGDGVLQQKLFNI